MASLGQRLIRDALSNARYVVKYTPHSGKELTSQIYKTRKEAEAFASTARRNKESYDVKILPVMETEEGWRHMGEDYKP